MSLSIGARLKSAREAKGIGLEEAVRLTKIQRRTLQAIEEDRIEEVLDPTYTRIFLKKYASFLGLDGSVLAQEYAHLHSMELEPQALKEMEARIQGSSRIWKTVWAAAAGGLFLIGIVFLITLSIDVYGKLVSHQGSAKPSASVRPAPAASRSEERSQAWKPLVPTSQSLKLTVRTQANVWMQIKSDGAVIFQNVLDKGAQETWTAKQELELWTGNAGAMELVLNGKPLEGLGRGVKKGVKITHAGLKLAE